MTQIQSNHNENVTGSGWQEQPDQSCNVCYRLITLLLIILVLFMTMLLGSTFFQTWYPAMVFAMSLLLVAAIVIVVQLRREINVKLIHPLTKVIDWSDSMNQGNLSARIQTQSKIGYPNLISNINSLSERLSNLTNDMQQEVKKQTEVIERKNHSLEVLYDVAAAINISNDLEDLLLRFLPTLQKVTDARAATVRLSNYDGQMRMIGSIGLDDYDGDIETLIPVLHCMYGREVQEGELLSKDKILRCEIYPGQPFYGDSSVQMIAVPLQYRSQNLGVYNLFIDKAIGFKREGVKDLLISIGRHLGVAIEKFHTDDESKRLSLYRERSLLSHELHDSLAQTLAALRFQIRSLIDSVNKSDQQSARREISQIQNGVDEAYVELRELIAHFRAPFDERGLIAAVENVIQKFRDSGDIKIFFQNQWPEIHLSSLLEMQVLRIIQESLNNIRKHSQARLVRILLGYNRDNVYSVLIEDDGVGISEPVLGGGNPGEQVGLSIMRERAHRLGGKLTIDSEPGEGTRIMLEFKVGQTDT